MKHRSLFVLVIVLAAIGAIAVTIHTSLTLSPGVARNRFVVGIVLLFIAATVKSLPFYGKQSCRWRKTLSSLSAPCCLVAGILMSELRLFYACLVIFILASIATLAAVWISPNLDRE